MCVASWASWTEMDVSLRKLIDMILLFGNGKGFRG